MQKPNESLRDYVAKPPEELGRKPPRPVSLAVTGEVETIRPLIPDEAPTKVFRFNRAVQPLWFRRMVAVGGGAIVMIALSLVSAILVGINEPIAGPELASDEQLGPPVQMEPFDILSASTEPATWLSVIRPSVRHRAAKPRQVTAYQPRTYTRPPQPIEPKFFPTTLIIYSENGEIKTRIEPWIQSS